MKSGLKLSSSARWVLVALPGVLGLVVIARTAGIYLGTDPLALGIVAAMGIGFALGFVELFTRLRSAAQIAEEVKALPVPATDACVDGASPGLRAFLRARIEHAGTPPVRESFTPYLVGLMVMLGLLGTLLGLFETLRGAGLALTESTDVDALRTGLSGPMRGLTRSFGCSAAGVMASAMLGLAAVFVRRAEAQALAAVHTYANGPLRSLSPLRRQLEALDRLAQQGEALPLAASSLSKAASTLDGLAERWEATHAKAVEVQQKAVVDAVARLRDDLTKSAAQAAKGMHDTVAPLITQSVAQTGEAAARHMNGVLEALERDMKGRREADESTRKALRDELHALRKWVEQDASARAVEAQKRLDVVDEAMRKHAEAQAELLSMHRDQAAAHVSAIAGAARDLNLQLSDDASARRTEASALLGDLAKRMDETARAQAERAQDGLDAVARLGERFLQEAQTRETALSARWERLAKASEESDARRLEQSEQLAVRLDQSLGGTAARLEAQTERLSSKLDEALGGTSMRLEAQTERMTQKLDQTLLGTAERWEAQTDRIAKMLDTTLGGTASRLEAQTERITHMLEETLGGTSARLEAQSERMAAKLDETLGGTASRLEAQTERMAHMLDETLGGTATRLEAQSERMALKLDETFGITASRIEQLLTQRAESDSEQAVRAQLAFDALSESSQTLQRVLMSVEAQQNGHAKLLSDELNTHAQNLGKGLESTTSLVHEAATVLKANSIEMAAVAEMFAASVDRQREAAKTWIESLGEIEGAVERAGRGAAADALGDQLASTQEVFARQLQFQRELFEQLRSLRVSAPQPSEHSHSEQVDVSA